jgi:hypothetical protein
METQAPNRRDMETALIEKCWKDPEFKKAVINDPRTLLEQRTGRKLPPNLKIYIHEEDANTLHLTIPPSPTNVTELSEDELESVAGGTEITLIYTAVFATVGVAMTAASVGGVVGGKQAGW